MKKYISIIMVFVMSVLCIIPCSAQVVDSRENGCTFELSDDWIPVPDMSVYTHKEYAADVITIESYPANIPVPVEVVGEEALYQFFASSLSQEAIAQRISADNNVNVTVSIIGQENDIVKSSSGQIFYMYNLMYEITAPGYEDTIESMSLFFTVVNGKTYYIMYMSDNSVKGYSDFIEMVDSMEFDNDYIEIYIDDNQVFPDSAPMIVEGRTLVPIRAIAEEMGYDVKWIGEEQKVVITDSETTLEFVIGGNVAYKNSTEEIILDVPATIYADRTYLPLRAVGEALGAKVEWDGDNIAVDITLNK